MTNQMRPDNDGEKSRVDTKTAQLFEPYWDCLSRESERGFAILSVCFLDYMLERLLKAFFIKDRKVDSLFKNDKLLQSFYSKLHIAYFSELIPEIIFHDSLLINEIRNKFAHDLSGSLSFNTTIIKQRIEKLWHVRDKTEIPSYSSRVKFTLVVQRISDIFDFGEDVMLDEKMGPIYKELIIEKVGEDAHPILTAEEVEHVIQGTFDATRKNFRKPPNSK